MFKNKRGVYQKLVKLSIISILSSNSLIVYATDVNETTEKPVTSESSEENLSVNSSMIQLEETIISDSKETTTSEELAESDESYIESISVEETFDTTTSGTTSTTEITEATKDMPFDPYFPLEPNEEDLKGDKVNREKWKRHWIQMIRMVE